MLSPDVTIDLAQRIQKANETVIDTIHEKDNMFMPGHNAAYLSVGRRALALLCETFDKEQRLPKSILDFPCGWGRATRWFRAAFPEIEIGAGDVWHEAVDHNSKTFDTTPIYSHENLSEVECGQYDCIFVGSLVTHFNEEMSIEFIDWALDHLTDNGIAIITSHGRFARKGLIAKPHPNAFPEQSIVDDVVGNFDTSGFGYAPYRGASAKLMSSMDVEDYGHSLASASWWMDQIMPRENAMLMGYIEKGWNNHQDVVILKKSSI